MPSATAWMEPEIIIMRQVRRESETPCDIICMWNIKYDTMNYLWSRNKPIDIENRFVVAEGEGKNGKDREFGISRIQTSIYRMNK